MIFTKIACSVKKMLAHCTSLHRHRKSTGTINISKCHLKHEFMWSRLCPLSVPFNALTMLVVGWQCIHPVNTVPLIPQSSLGEQMQEENRRGTSFSSSPGKWTRYVLS